MENEMPKEITKAQNELAAKNKLQANALNTGAAVDGLEEITYGYEKIPESQGDLADRAELEIENEIQGQIQDIRRQAHLNK